MRYFVTGTGTGAGKTWVCSLLLQAANASGILAVGFKPVACGDRDDAVRLRDAGAPGPTLDEVNPLFYRQPLSPLAAGWMENRAFDLPALLAAWADLSGKWEHVIVEGAGGWEVPVTSTETMADVAVALGLPVLVVVQNQLGALNHTILTVRAVQARGLSCAGLILNYPQDERDSASISNAAVLRAVFPDIPVAEIIHGETSWPPDTFPFA